MLFWQYRCVFLTPEWLENHLSNGQLRHFFSGANRNITVQPLICQFAENAHSISSVVSVSYEIVKI